MAENSKVENNQSEEFKKGFDDGFHKGIVQGYIKGHTDASDELTVAQKQENNFMAKIVAIISKVFKENLFSNTSIQSLLNAIKSLIKNIGSIKFPKLSISTEKPEPVLA